MGSSCVSPPAMQSGFPSLGALGYDSSQSPAVLADAVAAVIAWSTRQLEICREWEAKRTLAA